MESGEKDINSPTLENKAEPVDETGESLSGNMASINSEGYSESDSDETGVEQIYAPYVYMGRYPILPLA